MQLHFQNKIDRVSFCSSFVYRDISTLRFQGIYDRIYLDEK